MKLLNTLLSVALILTVTGSSAISHGAELQTAVFYVA